MSLIFVSLEFYLVSINVEDTKLVVFFIHDNIDGLKLIEYLILVVVWVIGINEFFIIIFNFKNSLKFREILILIMSSHL